MQSGSSSNSSKQRISESLGHRVSPVAPSGGWLPLPLARGGARRKAGAQCVKNACY